MEISKYLIMTRFKNLSPAFLVVLLVNLIIFGVFVATQFYFPALMLLHIATVLGLWGVVLWKTGFVGIVTKHSKELIVVAVLVAVALFVRLYQIEEITPGMYGDEVSVGSESMKLLQRPDWPPFVGLYSHPTPLMYMTAGSVQTFGHTMTAVRLPSVVFGVLSVAIFYLLLRLFFPVEVATIGSSLMVFAYGQVILSRLAYEPPAAIFWQIMCLVFLVQCYRSKNLYYLIGLALSIGAGLYTYLSFRNIGAVFVILAVYLLWRAKKKMDWKILGMFIGVLFVAAMPLLSYIIVDPYGFWLRAAQISIFGRGYSQSEFLKELWGNISRSGGFFAVGDPNPDKNPSNVPIFDFITCSLAALGMVWLFLRKQMVFWVMLVLFIPVFISDIFSTEVIPEFHYYGLGHPNLLRVSGLIPLILLLATVGVFRIYSWLAKRDRYIAWGTVLIVVVVVNYLNWHYYFDQKETFPQFFVYNQQVNNEDVTTIIKSINGQGKTLVGFNDTLIADERTPFFLNKDKKLNKIDTTSVDNIAIGVGNNEIGAMKINPENVASLQQFVNGGLRKDYAFSVVRDFQGHALDIYFERR